ncbi:hypothetical protein [Rouxiella sp. WC2420]|uniref:Uncharacterized protein n=1 Tax=Rouxiella sp. WC2420 TaxID=3234145 RepID=A0AB39VX23_9GAMM
MTSSKPGMLFVATNVAAQDEADFNQWYDREHVEERVRIEGFLSGTRYQSLQGGRKYLGLYKTESLESFTSEAYHAAFTRQTAWSVANLQKMISPMRRVCAIDAVVGFGSGSHLAIITLTAGKEGSQITELGEMLFAHAGFISSSLLTPDTALSTPLPKESKDNRQLLSMMLIESSSAEASQRLAAHACHALDCPLADVIHYGLSWQLTAQELKS